MGKSVVLIPAFNEAVLLPGVLAALRGVAGDFEVVVVDDGSSDQTTRIATQAGAVVLRHPLNLGYGAALQTGYKYALHAGATLVVQMDADAQHDPRDIARLVEPVLHGQFDLVIGSRFLDPTSYEMGALKSMGRFLFQALARLFGLTITDPTSGLQAMNRRVLDIYVEDFFPSDYPDVDVLLEVHRRGLRIGEVSVTMSPSSRRSLLHHGLAPLYYVYKMLLSIFATTMHGRRPEVDNE